ncbi:MAG TPA: pitrilysin family protein, partial [Phycisphaerae bacterium]|nr:pitrilysin family protein [Phycisphaerae bacterium]
AKRPADFPATPPAGKLSSDFTLAAHENKKLANGLEVVCVPNRELPLVDLNLEIRSGSWTETKPGAASAAMNLMTKATRSRDVKAMAETLEFNAIHLGASSDMDTAEVSMSAMLPQLELGTSILRDVIENPTFPADEFDIQEKQTKMGLMVSSRQPEYVAEREFRRRLYGTHPYARTPTGELGDLDKLKIDDLRAWWSANVRPENAVLYISGDIDPKQAFALAEKHFGDWKVAGEFVAPKLPNVDTGGPTHIFLVDRPGSVQSQIRVGHLGVTRRDEIYPATKVLSNILGGGFNSRLNKAIRVEKGLTYGARGGFTPRRFVGEFEMSTFTKTPKTADTLRTLLAEVEKIRSGEPTEMEISDTKTYLQGAMAREQETASQVVSKLWMIETEGLPADYFSQYMGKIRSASAADILSAAKKLIDPAKLAIIVVGESKAIKADLEKIAPVTVVNQTTTMPAEPAGESGEN